MRNKLIVILALSILLTGWASSAYAAGGQAIDSSSTKTVTLQIEGMT